MRRTTLLVGTAVAALAVTVACNDETTAPKSDVVSRPNLFTSASSDNFEQCANNTVKQNPDVLDPCSWIHSVLGKQNSRYGEGEAIAERMVLNGLSTASGNTHTLTFTYGVRKGNPPADHGNYDLIVGYDATLGALANVCLANDAAIGVICDTGTDQLLPGVNHRALAIPKATFTADPSATSLGLKSIIDAAYDAFLAAHPVSVTDPSGGVRVDIFGGTITGFSNVKYVAVGGDIEATFAVTFTAERSDVMLAWGGRFASSVQWGEGHGAAGQSGSPFHFKMVSITDAGQTIGIGALGNNVSGNVIEILPPALSLTKLPETQTVSAGAPFSWTVTLHNAGPGAAVGAVINDALPVVDGITYTLDAENSDASCSLVSNVLECGPQDLASGADLVAKIDAATTPTTAVCAAGTITNTATGQAAGTTTIQKQATVTLECGNLSLAKLPASQTVNAGAGFSWTVTLTNAGPGTAFNAVISDALPVVAGIAYTLDAANSDATCSLTGTTLECGEKDLVKDATLVAKIDATTSPTAAACAAGTITNTATGQATGTAVIERQATVTLECGKLALTKLPASQTIDAGQPFSWTVTLTNEGPGSLLAGVINDALPVVDGVAYTLDPSSDASCSLMGSTLECGPKDLAKDATIAAKINATTSVTTAVCAAGTITNTATGDATALAQVTKSATVTLNCPNLQITKTPDQAGDAGYVVLPGGTATFKITVKNIGAGAATNVVITDPLPNGVLTWAADQDECSVSSGNLTCSGGDLLTLAAGASFIVNVSATIPTDYLVPTGTGTAVEPLVVTDGNLIVNGSDVVDWANAGIVCVTTGCQLDASGSTDNSFGQGTKEDTPVPTVVTGSIPPNKSDLTRFYVTSRKVAVGGSTHDFLYLAWERVQEPSGTTNMDFEINQHPITQLSANGVTVVRKAGDILVKFDLAQGGTNPVLGFHRWVTSGACEASGAKAPCWGPVQSLAGAFEASINQVQVTDPIAPNAPRTLSERTFGEAGIDLQASGIFQPGVCLNFGSAYLKSRSSDSFTAAIKDFVAPAAVSVQVCQDKLLNNTASAAADGLTAVSDNGQIKVVAPTALLFTDPANLRFAQAGVAGTFPTGVLSPSVGSTGVASTGFVPAADALEASGRRQMRRPADRQASVAVQVGRGARLAQPHRAMPVAHRPMAA